MDGRIDPSRLKFIENVIVLPRVGSTNALSRELVDYLEGEEATLVGTVLVALEQTEGRGRAGRTWVSPPEGGLYMTFLVPLPEQTPLTMVPIAAAVRVAEGIRAATACEVALKWPNDLLAEGGKLGGILTEARTQGERTYAAVGVGVNVFDVPGSWNGLAGATTIERVTGGKPSSSRLFQAIIEAVDDFFAVPRWDEIRERWMSLAIHRQGDILRVRNGETEITGKYRGLDERGFLKLETEEGEIRVLAGEVTSW